MANNKPDPTFQRKGAISNAHVGRAFEKTAQQVLQSRGISLNANHKVFVGIGNKKKERAFDLGSEAPKTIVECKSHNWTSGNNVPSAKITVWNEAMYYFAIAPLEYRKIFFVLRDIRQTTQENIGETLAEYYVRNYSHLIPPGVEIWECDPLTLNTRILL